MTKRMLIDATHAEETRIVVLDGNRLEDFDVETSTKRQLKGNIYLAKVVRVEPSLQAAFVEYGGGRHGFLAFGEIHPDYYQIPVADRQRLIEMQAEEARLEEEEADLEVALEQARAANDDPSEMEAFPPAAGEPILPIAEEQAAPHWAMAAFPPLLTAPLTEPDATGPDAWAIAGLPPLLASFDSQPPAETPESPPEPWARASVPLLIAPDVLTETYAEAENRRDYEPDEDDDDLAGDMQGDVEPPETVGGGDADTGDDRSERRAQPRFLRNYKIQEVIRRRQILLVQVVKEERGTKGAALTTYLSLAGRFSVLMPNSPRGGGISRKITSAADRRRLKEIMTELDIPRGMGMIVRTAGAQRPKPEIKRDCEYLLRLWDDIREHTMKSVAPALIYEEASLIKRSIRDVYSRDIEEILVDGEDGWRAAHDFMRMLMPTHAKKVQLWKDPTGQPLFARSQVEAQLDGMLMPIVQLRSGGYLVINQAEALVAIDVNSGRSTRERNIEETALRTNLEAADEVARQLRLRDLAGLIVIDFIDMELKRHNAMVERRLNDALKNDRARIQIGQISHFGLLEMSRQRLRPSLAETSFIACPHCGGTGHVRSTENAAIHVLRGIEDEGGKRRAAEIVVHLATSIALYLLNHKRDRLREIEIRYSMRVIVAADDSQISPLFRIERARPHIPGETYAVIAPEVGLPPPARVASEPDEDDDVVLVEEQDQEPEPEPELEPEAEQSSEPEQSSEDGAEDVGAAEPCATGETETAEEADRRRKRRRRRRRGRRDDEGASPESQDGKESESETPAEIEAEDSVEAVAAVAEDAEPADAVATESTETDEEARNRRRGRRGGRRRRREDGDVPVPVTGMEEQPELPMYSGPTLANPFGGEAFDIFDVMEQAEQSAEAARLAAREPEPAANFDMEPVADIRTELVADIRTELVAIVPILDAPVGDPPAEPVLAEPAREEPSQEEPSQEEPSQEEPSQEEPMFAELATVEPAMAATAEAEDVLVEPVAEPAAVAERRLELVAAPTAVLDTTAQPSPAPTMAEAFAAEPIAPVAETRAEPTSEPAIKPIVIGVDEIPTVEKKRGWWRR